MNKEKLIISETKKLILNIINNEVYKNIQVLIKNSDSKNLALKHLSKAAEQFKKECSNNNEKILQSLKEMMDKITVNKDTKKSKIEKIQLLLYRSLVEPHLMNYADLIFDEVINFEVNDKLDVAVITTRKYIMVGIVIAGLFRYSWEISELLLRKYEDIEGFETFIDGAIEEDVEFMLINIMRTLYFTFEEKELPEFEF